MKFTSSILAANALSIVCVGVASYLISTDHPGFGAALIVLAFWCAHSVADKSE